MQEELYKDIITKGCCRRCALRYIGYCKTLITFDDPDICLMNFGFVSLEEELLTGPKCKNKKPNPCVVCLGLLQDPIMEQMLVPDNLKNVLGYENTSFVVYITFPTAVLVRDHSMKMYLQKKFPLCFDVEKVIKVNQAWRYSMESRLCQILNKTYDHLSKLTIHYYTSYPLDEQEIETLENFATRNRYLSKHNINSLLENIRDEEFEKLVTVPPKIPMDELVFQEIKYFSESIYLLGRYCKYSRELPTLSSAVGHPQIFPSVGNILENELRTVATSNFKDTVFTSSGYDEPNIRVLGIGRTFKLQIIDPKFEKLSREQLRRIEKEIKCMKELEITNLQQADKRNIRTIMDSEQRSPRTFKILCLLYQCKSVDYCVNAVNMYKTIYVKQKTPIRILHLNHRDRSNRKKKIYYIRAKRVTENLIELEMCSECGLYIPEFIHGDFGRTRPSLVEIIKAKVDLLALDVTSFNSTLPCAIDENDVVI